MDSGPILLRRRTGLYGGIAVGLILGIGPFLAGFVGIVRYMDVSSGAFWRGILYFALAATPGLLGAIAIILCRSELFLVPEQNLFRLVSYRPWRRPRAEEVPAAGYAGVRVEGPNPKWGNRFVVSLVGAAGDEVPIQSFRDVTDARALAETIRAATGMWVRGTGG